MKEHTQKMEVQSQEADSFNNINPPPTKIEDVVEKVGEHLIHDSYRWLEDSDSEETQSWIRVQNEYLDKSLRGKTFEVFFTELTKSFRVVNFSTPIMRKGKYFFSERQPGEDHHAVWYRKSLDSEPIKLVDPNGMNETNTVSVDGWSISKSGKYLVYGLSEGGKEMATLHLKDVETNTELPDQIERCRFSRVQWLSDDSGFYYMRNPHPGSVSKNEEYMHQKIYFHKLGDNPDDDVLIFGKDRPKDDMLGFSLSVDGRYLCIHVSQNWHENELYIYDRQTETTTQLVTGIHAKFQLVFLIDRVIIKTNYRANNKRVLWVPLGKLLTPIDDWEELIPEQEYLLESVGVTKSKLIIEYSVNACSKLSIFNHDGIKQEEVPIPEYASLVSLSGNIDEEEFFYGVDSFTFPKIEYRYDPKKKDFEEFRRVENPVNPDNYVVKQEWFNSKDGVSVPLFIVYRKDVSGIHPTVLYGYGGFSLSKNPAFMRSWIPWIKRGGVFAVANIRGGGEFGEQWHEEGIKEKKQNSFNDFISAAEHLIKKGYTDSDHLGIVGGSNGGLLVSAVEVQRPELFKAVCSQVPLTDMVRFPQFGIAIRWIPEYGDPKKKEELENILKWSPYHNVKEGVEYPATLFTTAENDTRVNPLHARKMAALFQSVNKKNNVFIFSEIEAGHGPGKPIRKIVQSHALILAFLAQQLELTVK